MKEMTVSQSCGCRPSLFCCIVENELPENDIECQLLSINSKSEVKFENRLIRFYGFLITIQSICYFPALFQC